MYFTSLRYFKEKKLMNDVKERQAKNNLRHHHFGSYLIYRSIIPHNIRDMK